jgi:ribonuclease J
MVDRLMIQGAKVIYGREQGIHVSGHGCQEDQKMMIALTRPKFFLPVHGEHRMLVRHSQTAQSMGIPAENMVIIDNGDVVELTQNSIRVIDKVPAGIELMDRGGIVKAHVLQERQQLAEDGIITVAVAVGTNGQLQTEPDVHLRGVVTPIEQNAWQAWVRSTLESCLRDRWGDYARNGNQDIDWAGLKTHLERELVRLLLQPITVKTDSASASVPGQSPAPASANGSNGSLRRRRNTATLAS